MINEYDANMRKRSSTLSTISSGISSVQNPKEIEMIYSYVMRCCLFPFKQDCTDFFCNQKVSAKFKSYTYKKKVNMVVKTPKSGSNNNIDVITKYLYSITLGEFYKGMDETGMFKEYLLLFVQLMDTQVRRVQPTYNLSDSNCDTIIISSTKLFVKLFRDFAFKHLENFNESKYDIFKSNVYLSSIAIYLRDSSNVENLESSVDIQNWARKIFKIDSKTNQRILESTKKIINQKVRKRKKNGEVIY